MPDWVIIVRVLSIILLIVGWLIGIVVAFEKRNSSDTAVPFLIASAIVWGFTVATIILLAWTWEG